MESGKTYSRSEKGTKCYRERPLSSALNVTSAKQKGETRNLFLEELCK